jgi:A/G-specific adenine glycosylase
LAQAAQEKELWLEATVLLPARGIETYTQGLMDLGATVCLARQPKCNSCPLAGDCVALAQGRPQAFPVKTRKLKRGRRSHALLWLEQGNRVWLVQRPATGVWAGLWSFQEFDSAAALDALSRSWPGRGEWLPAFDHTLTHFDWTLQPLRWRWPARVRRALSDGLPAGRWFDLPSALGMGLPAPVRRLLQGA